MAEVKKSSEHHFAPAGLTGKAVVLTVDYENNQVTLKDQDGRDIALEKLDLTNANAWKDAITEALTLAATLLA